MTEKHRMGNVDKQDQTMNEENDTLTSKNHQVCYICPIRSYSFGSHH